jgi:hypothetical protein
MRSSDMLRRLLVALADESPAFHGQVPARVQPRWQRLASVLADSSPAFQPTASRDSYRSSPMPDEPAPAQSADGGGISSETRKTRAQDRPKAIQRQSRSWGWRIQRASAGEFAEHRRWSRIGRLAGLRTAARQEVAVHAADSRILLAQDAALTAATLQGLGPVLTALQPTKDAVVRIGSVLIVKVDWVVAVHQLTATQQLELDHHPQWTTSPRELLQALSLETDSDDAETQPTHGSGEPDRGSAGAERPGPRPPQ